MRLQEDKTRFINNLPWNSEEEKNKVLDFFKVHANLESKIQNWQSRDKEGLVNEIRNLISETEKASFEKEKVKQSYRGNIDWEAHDCKYLGEDEKWIYITPLSWNGGKFCDSAECGGAGAKWCIGYEKSDENWKYYRKQNALFLMKFNKYPEDKQKDLKFMIEGYLGEDKVNIWNQTDHKRKHTLSKSEKEYLKAIQGIWDDIKKELFVKYFDNPEPGVYIAKNEEALRHIEYIRKDLKVFKAAEGLTFKNVEDASYMFKGCESLTSIDTSAFVNVRNTERMFQDCKSLTSINTSAFKNVKDASYMFQYCKSLASINTSAFVNVENASFMFHDCTSLASVDTAAFKNVKNASWMFKGCESLKSIDTSGFVNVENASDLFEGCTSLTSIDTSIFKNVETATRMFGDCCRLTSIDTSAFKNVKDAGAMFQDCTSLASIDTSVFKNVKNAGSMFWGCTSLTSIDTSAFGNVWNTSWMFYSCKSLAYVDTTAFKNVESALAMFQDCTSLTSIDASAFVNVKWNESDMFDGCTSLKAYIPGPNRDVNRALEKIGAKPVKRLGESFRRRVIEEILEE